MTTLQINRLAEEFDPLDEAEHDTLAFDFTDSLAPGETLSGAAVAVALLEGTDATPGSFLDGAATITGAVVMQPVIGRPAGAKYGVRCVGTMAPTGRQLTLAGTVRTVRLGA